jgi:predicted DNA-binding transcriptional regulator YafY
MERKRLVADRFRRIWRIVEDIAHTPGKTRRQLAEKFALSERQVQADLNIIRSEMGLPLVRRGGYRFLADPASNIPSLTLREAQLLLLGLQQLSRDRSVLQQELKELFRKLPAVFPPHLRPLVQKTLDSSNNATNLRQQQIFNTLAEATLHRGQVRLHYQAGDPSSPIAEPIVQAELLLPYLDSWYLVGECQQRQRLMMFDLEGVTAVTPLFRT